MGLLIGLPIYVAGLLIRRNNEFCRQYIRAAMLVVLTALLIGLVALGLSFVMIDEHHLPSWMTGRSVGNPVAFARAGMMHNYSYNGGLAGLISGLVLMVLAARNARPGPKIAESA